MANRKISKLRAILRKEGLPGLIGRLRHRRTGQDPLKAPVLPDRVALLDHGHPRLAALMAAFLQDIGVGVEPKRQGSGPLALHVGWPAVIADLQTGDLLIDIGAVPVAGQQYRRRASLILAPDPARLADASAAGTHQLSLPAPPDRDSDAEWSEYAHEIRFPLQRFAFFCGRLAPEQIDYTSRMATLGPAPRICLSLPEMPERRSAFQARGLAGFTVLDGLKRQPPWQGAASSYRALAHAALELGHEQLTVIQDDALPCPDFSERLRLAESYFSRSGADMFSGLITDVDESFHITHTAELHGMSFVHLNKSVGLVFNIFGRRALEHLSQWRENGGGVDNNTIDRYLSRAAHLRVVTCLPALIGHDSRLQSSIWSFRNARYDTLIQASQKRLNLLSAHHPVIGPGRGR